MFGLIVLVVVAAVVFYLWRNGTFTTTGGAATSTDYSSTTAPPTTNAAAVERLRAHDPAFDPDAFGGRVSAGFMKLQDAWCRQDLSAVRPFISDAVHERFAIQFAEQKAGGYRDRMADVAVDAVAVVDATSDAVYDAVAVHLVARARDQRVSIQGDRVISGSAAVRPFAEVWSFLRRRGAHTLAAGRPGLLEGNCPNCGAPVELNESASCAACGPCSAAASTTGCWPRLPRPASGPPASRTTCPAWPPCGTATPT